MGQTWLWGKLLLVDSDEQRKSALAFMVAQIKEQGSKVKMLLSDLKAAEDVVERIRRELRLAEGIEREMVVEAKKIKDGTDPDAVGAEEPRDTPWRAAIQDSMRAREQRKTTPRRKRGS